MSLDDSDILELSKRYESENKSLKHTIYKISWYMRGGVDAYHLMHHTDVEDIEILQKIIDENLEATKKSGMPLL